MEAPRADEPPRRRWPAHIIISCVVLASMVALLAITARGSITPARSVIVRPVLLAPQSHQDHTPASDTATSPQRSTTTVQAPGWLEAEPFYIACTALADGVVAEVLVLEGDRVEAGQLVARLVSEDAELALARAQAQLASEEARLASAQAEVTAARADWENPVERDRAVASTHASLAEARAELARLPDLIREQTAVLERLREELQRSRDALSSQAATDIEVIILEKQVSAQAAATEALRADEQILSARIDRLTSEARAADRNAELRITERRALDVALANEQHARAAVALATAARDEARLRLDRMRIHAPIAGFVQRRLKVPGDKVMLAMDDPHSSHILHLYDPSRLQVRVDVPLADAANVFVDQRCEIVVDVLPDQTFAGRVLRITHEADIQKNTLQVKVQIIDPSPLLRPEMLARVKFLPGAGGSASPTQGAAAAPSTLSSALVHVDCIDASAGPDAQRVWVVRSRKGDIGVVEPAPVTLQKRDAPWALVASELRPGDLLVAHSEGLTRGQRVRMQSPAAKGAHS